MSESLVAPLREELIAIQSEEGGGLFQFFARVKKLRDRLGDLGGFVPAGTSEDEVVAIAKRIWDEIIVPYDIPRIPEWLENILEKMAWQWLEASLRHWIPDNGPLPSTSPPDSPMNYDGQQLCGTDTTQAASGSMCRWPRPDITWAIIADLPGFATESFRAAAELAWSYWSTVCGIRPKFVTGTGANVLMGIQTIGPGGVLADSELPCGVSMSSQLRQRYDTAEAWVVSENPPANKIDLVRVICHEVGHAIGIPHIGTDNLMAPVYSTTIRMPKSGDIAEAVARYGLPTASPTPPAPTPPASDYEEVYALLSKGGKLFVRAKGIIAQLP